ncbi:MAG: polyprenyl synthetase family protein [Bdellovibrionales bacterium]|nr:polyprenyl synthetase family protein [Bdellovibrionales bacterium]
MIADFLDALPKDSLESSKNMDLQIRSVNAHQAIDAILSKTVLRGGKRLRPLLTFLMAHLFRVDSKLVTPFARASELVHAASLSHDDVIDNATIRRGAPSINVLASNKKAVLAGDYLLSSVIVDLTNAGNLELVREMSLVIKDLSEGEWLQLDLIDDRNYTRELIREVAMKKTSSVMSYCSVAPAILSGADKKTVELCREFGKRLGLAFQLIDDTLDYSGDSQKDQELDLKNGIVNAVVYELLEHHSDLFERFKKGEDLINVVSGIAFSSFVEKVSSEAQAHLEAARHVLEELEVILSKQDFYSQNPSDLKTRIEALELIISYMALRQH